MGLPALGSAAEHALWDLKQEISTVTYHLAKDVASFANHYGGTILVGAAEELARVDSYHPLSLGRVSTIEGTIMTAVRDLCSPLPVFDYERFEKASGWILAVNVWPSISTLVAVRVTADKAKCGYGGDAFVFPTRLVNHSDTIDPEAFPMYMLPELRRTLLLLYGIPKDADLTVYWVGKQGGSGANGTNGWRLTEVNERANYATFTKDTERGREDRAPLDAITRVFRSAEGAAEEWKVFIEL